MRGPSSSAEPRRTLYFLMLVNMILPSTSTLAYGLSGSPTAPHQPSMRLTLSGPQGLRALRDIVNISALE
jgi:hypothetical protein